MEPDQVVQLMRELAGGSDAAERAAAGCGAPIVSLGVSLVQTLTSVQEQTLTAVPRLVGGVCRDDGVDALDDSSAGGLHAAPVRRFPPVSG